MNIADKLAQALRALLERGVFDDDGDFCVYATEAEQEVQQADDDDLGIEEVKAGYAALAEYYAPQQAPSADVLAGERAAFEAWWPTVGQTIGKAAAWAAWQARGGAVAELVGADREVDAIEDELHRAYLAGPRPHSYGTGWEARDAAAAKDRAQRLEAAHKRRAAALARMQGGAA